MDAKRSSPVVVTCIYLEFLNIIVEIMKRNWFERCPLCQNEGGIKALWMGSVTSVQK